MPNPDGTVIPSLVVVRPLFSVGTARLYSCSLPATDTGGLMRACAEAIAVNESPAPAATIATSPIWDIRFKLSALVGDQDRAAKMAREINREEDRGRTSRPRAARASEGR